MSVRIRLRRVGRKKQPYFRVVVAKRDGPRDGAYIEELGFYNPRTRPALLTMDMEKVDEWIDRGAEVSDTVKSLIRKARKGGDSDLHYVKPGEEAPRLKTATKPERRPQATQPEAEDAGAEDAEAEEAEAEEGGAEVKAAVEPPADEAPPTEAQEEAETESEAPVEEPEAEAEEEPEAKAEEEPEAEAKAEEEPEAEEPKAEAEAGAEEPEEEEGSEDAAEDAKK